MTEFTGYQWPLLGTQPNVLHLPYISLPSKPLIHSPRTISEITVGTVFAES